MVDEALQGTRLDVRFRKSQLKFKEPAGQRAQGDSAVLGLVEPSRPYTFGYLNQQVHCMRCIGFRSSMW